MMNNPALVSRVDTALPQTPSPLFNLDTGATAAGGPPKRNLKIGGALRRFWWLFLILWVVLAAFPVFYVLHAKKFGPKFPRMGDVEVAPSAKMFDGQSLTTVTPYYTKYLNTQAAIMRSPRVLEIAAADPRLRHYKWFQRLPDQLAYLRSHLYVSRPAGTELIRVQYSNASKHVARDVVNSVLTAYMLVVGEQQQQNVRKRLDLLRHLRDSSEALLQRDEDQLHQRMSQSNSGLLVSVGEEKKINLQMLASTDEALQATKSDDVKLANQLKALETTPPVNVKRYEKSIATDSDRVVQQYRAELIGLQAKDEALAAEGATNHHPVRKALRRQIRKVHSLIAARLRTVRRHALEHFEAAAKIQLAAEVRQTKSNLKTVNEQLAELEAQKKSEQHYESALNNRAAPIKALQEQIKASRESLKQYIASIQNLENQNAAPGRVFINSLATLRGPMARSKRVKYLAASGIGTFVLAFLATLLVGHMTSRIESESDLPDSLRPLVVGTVSNAGESTRGLQGKMKRKILGEEMRLVHANLLPPGQHDRRILMITSPTPGNGKTSIASHLALSLAKAGLEVLVVDADLRKRDLSTMFDIGFKPGLAELLQGQEPELVHPVELLPNFSVMGAGAKLDRNPAELFQRKHLREALDQVSQRFDCIIVDTPPVLVVAETRLMARSCDEVLCVVRAQMTSHRDIDQAVEAISRISGEMPKIIINGVQEGPKYYKYKYSYMDRTIAPDEVPAAASA